MKSLEKDVTLRECGVGLSQAGKFKGIYGVNESTIHYKRKITVRCGKRRGLCAIRSVSEKTTALKQLIISRERDPQPAKRNKATCKEGQKEGDVRAASRSQESRHISVVSQGLFHVYQLRSELSVTRLRKCISCVPRSVLRVCHTNTRLKV